MGVIGDVCLKNKKPFVIQKIPRLIRMSLHLLIMVKPIDKKEVFDL